MWHDRSGRRHLGSPLKALALSGDAAPGDGFTEVFLVNKDHRDHMALDTRIDMLVDRRLTNLPRDRIHVAHDDANAAVPGILTAAAG